MARGEEVGIEAEVVAKEAPIDTGAEAWRGLIAGWVWLAFDILGSEARDKGEVGAQIGMMLPGRAYRILVVIAEGRRSWRRIGGGDIWDKRAGERKKQRKSAGKGAGAWGFGCGARGHGGSFSLIA